MTDMRTEAHVRGVRMISRRNFVTIAILMSVLLFLCMCLNSLKDYWNDYAVNTYTETAENYPSRVNLYLPGKGQTETGEDTQETAGEEIQVARSLVVLVGEQDSALMGTAREWVSYTKRDLLEYSSLTDCRGEGSRAGLPEMLVLDSACVDWDSRGEVDYLFQCVEQGTHLVFCNLPDVSVIESNSKVRNLLGIRRVVEPEVTVEGLHLCGGFLLGGETIYEEEGGDMENVFPWYVLGSGTKAYMKGILEGDVTNTNSYPALIWRKSFGTAYVFAVNGGYMEGTEALGLLSAMSAEMYSYEIYPVLNAQNIILAGYPGLADENREEMDRVYSRSIRQVFQEIVWPGLSAGFEQHRYRATCMMTPQFDYRDGNLPDEEQFVYYLKRFKENQAEVGLSGQNVSDTPLDMKWQEDQEFFQNTVEGYDFTSFYGGKMTDEEIGKALGVGIPTSVRTVVTDRGEMQTEVVRFVSEDVTAQSTLGDVIDGTHRNDFLIKCLETSLGYLSVSFDMTKVAYPEGEEDAWEKMSRAVAVAITTYGKAYPGFDRTTASECDRRIRNLLAMDYQDGRRGNVIELEVTGAVGEVWFILRTHNESVAAMEGGSFRQLEQDAWLIQVQEEKVSITLEPSDERYYQ